MIGPHTEPYDLRIRVKGIKGHLRNINLIAPDRKVEENYSRKDDK
jgi:hypothetical protein